VCVLTEFLWQKITKKQVTAGDFSAVVTGMLLAFNMPVTVPVWVLGAAAVFSILIVKQMFGGIGSNFANLALIGRLLVMVRSEERRVGKECRYEVWQDHEKEMEVNTKTNRRLMWIKRR